MPRAIVTPPHDNEVIPDLRNFNWTDHCMRRSLPRENDQSERRRDRTHHYEDQQLYTRTRWTQDTRP